MKIALLYICTGEYIVFWKDFFESFEKYFLLNLQKEYFVFTDAEHLEGEETGRVHIYPTSKEPWPIPTLTKFHTFLRAENELQKFDYIYQPNSNTRCNCVINEDDFLPCRDRGEKLIFTTHPAKWCVPKYVYPYDRNPASNAYVPYHLKAEGVFGAMNGGEAEAYLELVRDLARRTEIDLKRGIIPIYHDESYINNFIVRHEGDSMIKFLPSEYANPDDYDLPFAKKISLADKSQFINVKRIKQVSLKRTIFIKILDRVKRVGRLLTINLSKLIGIVFHLKAK